MGFGHSHSHKKKNIRRRVASASKGAQHDLAHTEGKDHHDAPHHEWLEGRHHHAEQGQPFPDLPSSHHPHPKHAEGYPWAPVEHPDYGATGHVPPGHPHPEVFDPAKRQGAWAKYREQELGAKGWKEEVDRCIAHGLEAAPSVKDRTISTFARGELPHFAGINTFCKSHYLEDVNKVSQFDAAVIGVPFDIGTTYRSGTRFGPQGIRRISALYGTYNYEMGVDLRESLKICDVGDVFTIANIEKGFDQISKAVAHVRSNGVFPIMLGGDHSIGYPNVRGIAPYIDGPVGIIHIDRHVDTQETDMDERMHTTPWFHATNIPNAPPVNLVQLGIGGWQAPRPGVKVGRSRGTTVLTIDDIENMEGREGRLPELRRGFARCGICAGYRMAGAGRIPPARSAQAAQARGARGTLRHGSCRGGACVRSERHDGPGRRARGDGCGGDPRERKQARQKTADETAAAALLARTKED
jgi:arginase family enzyme